MPEKFNSPKRQGKKKVKEPQLNKESEPDKDSEQSDTNQVIQRIENLPPEKKEAVLTAITFSGPLPPAGQLQTYEQVVKGSADRIIKMAEEEAIHRRAQEERLIKSSCGDSRLGLWLGFIIGMGGIIVKWNNCFICQHYGGKLAGFHFHFFIGWCFCVWKQTKKATTRK
jgi:uncharacterized membrane protein